MPKRRSSGPDDPPKRDERMSWCGKWVRPYTRKRAIKRRATREE